MRTHDKSRKSPFTEHATVRSHASQTYSLKTKHRNLLKYILELELDASVNPSYPTDDIGEES